MSQVLRRDMEAVQAIRRWRARIEAEQGRPCSWQMLAEACREREPAINKALLHQVYHGQVKLSNPARRALGLVEVPLDAEHPGMIRADLVIGGHWATCPVCDELVRRGEVDVSEPRLFAHNFQVYCSPEHRELAAAWRKMPLTTSGGVSPRRTA